MLQRLGALVALVACLYFLATPAQAEEPASAPEREAVLGVISSQLQAFGRDDGAAAFSFAAPVIQQRFINPDLFMEMVREGYDPVYRPAEVEFRDTLRDGDGVIQKVVFVDRNGKAWLARYAMQRLADGSWRIAGVTLEALPDLST